MATLSTSSFWILTVLADGSRHGYQIMQEVSTCSDGEVSLKPTTLYTALDRLERDGLVAIDGQEIVSGRARRYYRLTDAGAARLAAQAALLERSARAARTRLGPSRSTQPATARWAYPPGAVDAVTLPQRLSRRWTHAPGAVA